MLPDCFAARLSGTLAEVEHVVEAVERAPSLEAAAAQLRLDIELPGALRWIRRRVKAVHRTLHLLKGLFPDTFADTLPTLLAFRQVLGVDALLLLRLREIAAPHLAVLPPVVGFRPPLARGGEPGAPCQHGTGPDPPAAWA